MKNLKTITLLFIVFISGCKSITKDNDKYQPQRIGLINIKDKITDIKTNITIGYSELYIIENFLLINELFPTGDRGIHLLDKNTFEYIASTGFIGRGPGEIARKGSVAIDFNSKGFWVFDHGKKLMWQFSLDSILNNDNYRPTTKKEMNNELFLEKVQFFNDSIALGKAIRPLSANSFERVTVEFNLNNNRIKEYGFEHHDAKGVKASHSYLAMNIENGIYVNCYSYLDLMTICDLGGNLKYNIYGPDWSKNKDFKKGYFQGVDIIDNNIIAAFLGDERSVIVNNSPLSNLPSQFLVFDLEGNFKYTIETGNKFALFCVDKENQRIICYFEDRENPLGFFSLNLDELKLN